MFSFDVRRDRQELFFTDDFTTDIAMTTMMPLSYHNITTKKRARGETNEGKGVDAT